jgi:phosphoribosylformylglycinamidine synthase I
MKCAVIRFPGSNCDQDCHFVLSNVFQLETDYVWHKDLSLEGYEFIMIPGGFSYGDYLRCGAIAQFSPIMGALKKAASDGTLILGVCNGFQILCESGLLPGALIRNKSLHFICEHRLLRVENASTAFTNRCEKGDLLNIPVAHGEGSYIADEATIRALNEGDRVILRYVDENGDPTESGNPNGSIENIAGICNEAGNVFGLMPHPERACDDLLGSKDGMVIFESIIESIRARQRSAA